MECKRWVAITSWIIIIGCCALTSGGNPEDTTPSDFSVLRNVLEASTIDSCEEVSDQSLTHIRQRRSVDGIIVYLSFSSLCSNNCR